MHTHTQTKSLLRGTAKKRASLHVEFDGEKMPLAYETRSAYRSLALVMGECARARAHVARKRHHTASGCVQRAPIQATRQIHNTSPAVAIFCVRRLCRCSVAGYVRHFGSVKLPAVTEQKTQFE